jgi:hypothetical protein
MVKANRNFRPSSRRNVSMPGSPGTGAPRASSRVPAVRAFLSARLGQPWKSVQDEYEKKFPDKAHPGLFDIWSGLVATGTFLKHGSVRVHTVRAGVVPLEAANCEFYVHPERGTLLRNVHYVSPEQKKSERETRRAEELHARMREVSAHEQAHRIDGIWYLVEMRSRPFSPNEGRPPGEDRRPVFDAVLGRNVEAADRFELEQIYGRRGVYGVRKRELSYRELRKLGLLPAVKA